MNELEKYITYTGIVGSRAYGLDVESSDVDTRGVFVVPAEMVLGLDEIPSYINGCGDTIYTELAHFTRQILKGNPNFVEILFACKPRSSIAFSDMIRKRDQLVSRQYVKNIIRMATSMHHSLLKGDGIIAGKQAANVVRCLTIATSVATTGTVILDMHPQREFFLDLRSGTFDAYLDIFKVHHYTAVDALETSKLPSVANKEEIVRIYRNLRDISFREGELFLWTLFNIV